MTDIVVNTNTDKTVAEVLRSATEHLHRALHEHPLIDDLLTSPSLQNYQAVLEGFHRYYEIAEPIIVGSARELGFAEQYPVAQREKWLRADLKSLGCHLEGFSSSRVNVPVVKLRSVADLVGCLYVVHGSALGGRTILRMISSLTIGRSCQFFTGEGEKIAVRWKEFQHFADCTCGSEQAKNNAIIAAKQTFRSIYACLNSP